MYVVLVVSFGCLVGWFMYVISSYLRSPVAALWVVVVFWSLFLPFVFVFVVVVDGSGNVNGTVVICYWSV